MESLGAAAPPEPDSASEEDDGEEGSVGEEGAAHDELRGALAYVVALTGSQRRDAPKQQLGPCQDGHGLPQDRVAPSDQSANPLIGALLLIPIERKSLEEYSQDDLSSEQGL